MPHGPEQIYDQMLVLRCQKRDAAAFAELCQRWHPKLLRHAYRMTGETDLACDVAQEAWMNIIKSINRLRDPATFPAWAFRITSRRAADAIGKRARDREAQRNLQHTATATRGIDPAMSNASAHDDLRKALHTLPLDDQAILALHYVEALSVRDLSRVFDIPRGTVKSRLFHARDKLRAAMQQSTTPTRSEVCHE